MNRSQQRELVKEIESSLLRGKDRAVISMFVQQQPWTFVEIVYWTRDGDAIYGYGFSKVCYPDEWRPGFGRWLATRRAAFDVVRKLEDWTKVSNVKLPEIVTIEDGVYATFTRAQST